MGTCIEEKNRRRINQNEEDKFKSDLTEEELKNKLTEFYNNSKIIKNENFEKNLMDSTFTKIQQYEEEKLTTYFLNKKDEFKDIIINLVSEDDV